ncbi:MAG TPA: formate dehydrogenase accessory sulfurtransferase FdhD [Actinomycetota bacterium]|nr:formate dehydrogenase accessory sulfurtransferase FdhD [Actinomycetota bacterium]
MTRQGSKTRARIVAVADGERHTRTDYLATEEPLEIRLDAGGATATVAVTMRTPGADFELAAGFLYGEGVVGGREDVGRLSYCTDPEIDAEQQYNIVNVGLTGGAMPDLHTLERHFMTSSACGICGKASLDALELRGCPVVPPGPAVDPAVLPRLPDALRERQGLFESTGGLHAAGLFTTGGELVALREDVGRHNAVDKLIGWALLDGRLPLSDHLLMVSGRSSYEILQKALAAGIPVVCAVSAPSSLAVDLARRFGMTLVGFLRGQRFNVYAGEERLGLPAASHR